MSQHRTVLVHVDPTLHHRLKLYIAQQDITISTLVRKLVREHLDKAPEGAREEEAT